MSEAAVMRSPDLHPRRTRWFAVVALTLAGGAMLLIAAGGIGRNLVYYWGPTELLAAGDKAVGATIRLGGLVAPGSLVRGTGASRVEFDVVDRKGALVHVTSNGVPPPLFREKIGVVVEGTMTPAGYFAGSRLMVSHSNEYRIPGETGASDVKDQMRTTRGLEGELGARP